MSEEERKFVLKLVVLGDPAVGKTSLINQYVQGNFKNNYMPTIGVNIVIKEIYFEKIKSHISLVLWDIAGQDKYELSHKLFLNGSKGAFLVYDITRLTTIESIESKWLLDFKNFGETGGEFILIGNKIDLKNLKKVPKEDGENLANKINAFDFFETSAKYRENVDKAFERLVLKILSNNKKEI